MQLYTGVYFASESLFEIICPPTSSKTAYNNFGFVMKLYGIQSCLEII